MLEIRQTKKSCMRMQITRRRSNKYKLRVKNNDGNIFYRHWSDHLTCKFTNLTLKNISMNRWKPNLVNVHKANVNDLYNNSKMAGIIFNASRFELLVITASHIGLGLYTIHKKVIITMRLCSRILFAKVCAIQKNPTLI